MGLFDGGRMVKPDKLKYCKKSAGRQRAVDRAAHTLSITLKRVLPGVRKLVAHGVYEPNALEDFHSSVLGHTRTPPCSSSWGRVPHHSFMILPSLKVRTFKVATSCWTDKVFPYLH